MLYGRKAYRQDPWLFYGNLFTKISSVPIAHEGPEKCFHPEKTACVATRTIWSRFVVFVLTNDPWKSRRYRVNECRTHPVYYFCYLCMWTRRTIVKRRHASPVAAAATGFRRLRIPRVGCSFIPVDCWALYPHILFVRIILSITSVSTIDIMILYRKKTK